MVSGKQGKLLLVDEQEQHALFSGEQLRDPFNWAPTVSARYEVIPPVPSTDGEEGELHLSGILWNNKKPVAVIDGSLVEEGETLLDRFYVVEITREHVLLRQGTEQVILAFEELDLDLGNQAFFNNGTKDNAKK